MQSFIHSSAAAQRISKHLPKLGSVACPIAESAGRILHEPILADRPLPPYDRAMMDGYAIRAADLAVTDTFAIAAQAPAGTARYAQPLACGEGIEIMTGAVVPLHADTVIPYEDTGPAEGGGFRITHPEAHRRGDAIHPKGSDHASGEVLVPAGCRINSHVAAVAATCGYASLKVGKRPSIAILSTGDELVPVEANPLEHQIRRSNDVAILTALNRAGLTGATRTHIPDAPEASARIVASAVAANDFVLITGGISMGKRDYIPGALNDLGLSCRFHGVRQKPGKPFAYWSNEHTGIFALPGNPLSTLSCLHHYAIPAIHEALGQTKTEASINVFLAASLHTNERLTRFIPVRLDAGGLAHPCPPNNSGDLVRILESHGYVVFDEGDPVTEGSQRHFHPWH